MSYQGVGLASPDFKGQVMDDLLILIGKANIPKLNTLNLIPRVCTIVILRQLFLILQEISQIVYEETVFKVMRDSVNPISIQVEDTIILVITASWARSMVWLTRVR